MHLRAGMTLDFVTKEDNKIVISFVFESSFRCLNPFVVAEDIIKLKHITSRYIDWAQETSDFKIFCLWEICTLVYRSPSHHENKDHQSSEWDLIERNSERSYWFDSAVSSQQLLDLDPSLVSTHKLNFTVCCSMFHHCIELSSGIQDKTNALHILFVLHWSSKWTDSSARGQCLKSLAGRI